MLPIGRLPGHYLARRHWVVAGANHNVFNNGGILHRKFYQLKWPKHFKNNFSKFCTWAISTTRISCEVFLHH